MKKHPAYVHHLIILPLITLLALTACLPTSEYPILVQGESVRDPALAGTWEGFMDDKTDPVTLYFIKTDEGREDSYPGGLDLIMILEPDNSQGPEDWAALYALTANIAGKSFLSIEYRSDNGEEITGTERGFHLFMYEITETDQLIVRGVDEDVLTELVEDRKTSGTLTQGTWFSEVRLTASSSELAALLKTVDVDRLFPENTGAFTRRRP